jgi:VWFA-related protein
VALAPLTRVDDLIERYAPGAAVRPAAQPKFPPPQTLREGDTIALDLMATPDRRERLTDYIRISNPGAAEIVTREAPLSFKTRSAMVAVPLVVVDAQGRSVGTLDRADFRLFDNGAPQAISRFSVERMALPNQQGPPQRFIAFVFDDANLDAAQIRPAIAAAGRHIATSLATGDRAAIFTASGRGGLDFTGDREALARALAGVQGASCADAAAADNESGSRRARAALDAVSRALAALSRAGGERVALLISPGFAAAAPGVAPNSPAWSDGAADLIETAVRSHIVVNAIDPGLTYSTLDDYLKANQPLQSPAAPAPLCAGESGGAQPDTGVLEDLAFGTGGRVLRGSDMAESLRLAASVPEHLYLLGFTPSSLKLDGKFHRLRVELASAKGLQVEARRGYYTPRFEQSPLEQAKRELEEAFFSGEQIHELPAAMETQFYKSDARNAAVAVLAKVDLKQLPFRREDNRNRNDLTVISGLFDADGNYVEGVQKIIEMRLRDETLTGRLASGLTVRTTLNVRPGRYSVRLVVRDAEGRQLTAESGAVEIP